MPTGFLHILNASLLSHGPLYSVYTRNTVKQVENIPNKVNNLRFQTLGK